MADENTGKDRFAPTGMGLGPLKKVEVVIHAMPKNFLGPAKGKHGNTKSTGIIILAVGIVLLIGLFAGFYYYISHSDNSEDLLIREVETEATVSPVAPTPSLVTTPQPRTEEINDLNQEGADLTATEDTSPEAIISDTAAEIDDSPAATSSEDSPSTPVVEPIITKPAADSDQDGLSDAEEKILGTNILNSDSDGDSFDDFSELNNLYNPAGEGQILTNPNIQRYANAEFNYTLYYPKLWQWETIGGDDSVLFKLENNQFIQVITQVNTAKQTLEEWYIEQFIGQPITPQQKIYKKGWTGITSADGLIIYLMHPAGSHIFTITYNIGLTSITDYKNIFSMMVESMEIIN